jgi:putative restriction endonuclease
LRLKAPRNAIGGFGIFARFDRLPEWLAWECFEQGNGAATLSELQTRLRNIREANKIAGRSGPPQIACIILSGAVFFPQSMWVRRPADWGRQNLLSLNHQLSTLNLFPSSFILCLQEVPAVEWLKWHNEHKFLAV